MSKWNWNHEKNIDPASANTLAGYYSGAAPMFEADSLVSKRNVIATDKGWIRRLQFTDSSGNLRTKDDVLVAAHPGLDVQGGYTNTAYLASPDITIMQLQANTATGVGAFSNTTPMTVWVSFNEPVYSTANVTITIESRDGATTFPLLSNTTNAVGSSAKILSPGANNTLVFTGTPDLNGGATNPKAGIYKVKPQTIAVTASGTLTSRNIGTVTANTEVRASLANFMMTVDGAILANGEFTLV